MQLAPRLDPEALAPESLAEAEPRPRLAEGVLERRVARRSPRSNSAAKPSSSASSPRQRAASAAASPSSRRDAARVPCVEAPRGLVRPAEADERLDEVGLGQHVAVERQPSSAARSAASASVADRLLEPARRRARAGRVGTASCSAVSPIPAALELASASSAGAGSRLVAADCVGPAPAPRGTSPRCSTGRAPARARALRSRSQPRAAGARRGAPSLPTDERRRQAPSALRRGRARAPGARSSLLPMRSSTLRHDRRGREPRPGHVSAPPPRRSSAPGAAYPRSRDLRRAAASDRGRSRARRSAALPSSGTSARLRGRRRGLGDLPSKWQQNTTYVRPLPRPPWIELLDQRRRLDEARPCIGHDARLQLDPSAQLEQARAQARLDAAGSASSTSSTARSGAPPAQADAAASARRPRRASSSALSRAARSKAAEAAPKPLRSRARAAAAASASAASASGADRGRGQVPRPPLLVSRSDEDLGERAVGATALGRGRSLVDDRAEQRMPEREADAVQLEQARFLGRLERRRVEAERASAATAGASSRVLECCQDDERAPASGSRRSSRARTPARRPPRRQRLVEGSLPRELVRDRAAPAARRARAGCRPSPRRGPRRRLPASGVSATRPRRRCASRRRARRARARRSRRRRSSARSRLAHAEQDGDTIREKPRGAKRRASAERVVQPVRIVDDDEQRLARRRRPRTAPAWRRRRRSGRADGRPRKPERDRAGRPPGGRRARRARGAAAGRRRAGPRTPARPPTRRRPRVRRVIGSARSIAYRRSAVLPMPGLAADDEDAAAPRAARPRAGGRSASARRPSRRAARSDVTPGSPRRQRGN